MTPSKDETATIYSVAALAGVSTATVSRVLQGTGRVSATLTDRVERAAADLHYVPLSAARVMARNKHDALGLVLPHVTGPYYADLLVGFETAAGELGLSVEVLLATPRRDAVRAARRMSGRVDGVAFVAHTSIARGEIEKLSRAKRIITVAGEPIDGISSVATESAASARCLTEHLLAHGFVRPAFVGNPSATADVDARYQGFADAYERQCGGPAPAPIRVNPRETAGAKVASDHLAAKSAGATTPDAYMCANDELALALLHQLQDGGVDVPGEVAVTGWDDVTTARYIRPGLTTVRQPVADLGRLAATRLHGLVMGATAVTTDVLATKIVLRESCGVHPAKTRRIS